VSKLDFASIAFYFRAPPFPAVEHLNQGHGAVGTRAECLANSLTSSRLARAVVIRPAAIMHHAAEEALVSMEDSIASAPDRPQCRMSRGKAGADYEPAGRAIEHARGHASRRGLTNRATGR
jgi:hypothetical protein